MNRKKKLLLNSTSSILYQLVKLLCGFILPRMFLLYYGSAVNGLVSSITQFLGFITLAECGVGTVVQSALYKPLADKDEVEISKIFISSERFFRKIAYILIIYTIALMAIYPFMVADSFGYMFTAILILAISINSFAEYYIGVSYQLLLGADQLGFIRYGINIIATIANTVICIILMVAGSSIQLVKFATSFIFMLQPLAMALIAKRRYCIDRKIVLHEEPIKQKWNGLAQHIAAVVLANTDTAILTLLSTLENVSVYSVYALVINGVKGLLLSLTNGVQSLFGDMLAKQEKEKLGNAFESFEWLMHTGVTFVFGVTAVLLVPFVSIYTRGVNDANYIAPAFGALLTLAQGVHCLRLPYISMVYAAGHYKQTQVASIMEALINVIVSVILVFKFGLIGVAVGTVIGISYRTFHFVFYLSKDIIYRETKHFIKHIGVDALNVFILYGVLNLFSEFFTMRNLNYLSWIVLAVKVAFLDVLITLVVNLIFYKKRMFTTLKAFKKK